MRILVRPISQATAERQQHDVRMPSIRIKARAQRVLDFDIENRPLSYLGSDFTTGEVTAIAWAWADKPLDVTVRLLGEHPLASILLEFVSVYHEADLVTGHYIRGHDLPMINAGLMELEQPVLSDKLIQDTKLDLPRMKGLSASQESLSAMFRLGHGKLHMTQPEWRAANRLTPEGLAVVRERAVSDVRQHLELRARLFSLGYLSPPRLWRSGGAQHDESYHP